MLPTGIDQTFHVADPFPGSGSGVLSGRCFGDASCLADFRAQLGDVSAAADAMPVGDATRRDRRDRRAVARLPAPRAGDRRRLAAGGEGDAAVHPQPPDRGGGLPRQAGARTGPGARVDCAARDQPDGLSVRAAPAAQGARAGSGAHAAPPSRTPANAPPAPSRCGGCASASRWSAPAGRRAAAGAWRSRYAARFRVPRRGALTVHARFLGTSRLAPRSAAPRTLRARARARSASRGGS